MELVLILCVIILIYFYFLKVKYGYWKKNGVKGPTPIPIVGNCGKLILMKQSLAALSKEIYQKYHEEKVVGLYCGSRKVILLRDPEIIKIVLTKDFKYFTSRGLKMTENGFSSNLLTSEGEVWKTLRKKLSPAFTNTKLKQMIPLIQECIRKLQTETEIQLDAENYCDVSDLCKKYSLDIICSCIFGLNLDVYCKEIQHFRDISNTSTQPSTLFWLWYVAEMIIPGIQKKFTIVNPGSNLRIFFKKLVTSVIRERERCGIKRSDLMNLMIEEKVRDSINIEENKQSNLKMDDNMIASQAFAFYVAGEDTSSSALTHLLYELSLNSDIQDKVYKEICEVFSKYGENSYDALKEMTYLTMVYKETMRKHPSTGFLLRQSDLDYLIPGTEVQLAKKTWVIVSLGGLHNDPKYFKNPESFNPDNFSTENSKNIPQYAYLPFGDGPRNCIGSRFAEVFILMGAAMFLYKFRVNNTSKEIKHNNKYTITSASIGGVWVNVTRR